MRAYLAAALTLAACGGGNGLAPGPDAGSSDPTPQFDDGVMRIDLRSQLFPGGTGDTWIAAVLSTTPPPWPYAPPVASGACRSFVRHDLSGCDPGCGPAAICDAGTCRPLPTPISAGPLTVAGGAVTRTIPFRDGYQLYVAQPLFAPGTEVTVSAPGADLPGFTLTARVPAALELVGVDQLVLARGRPLTVRWRPAGDGERVRLIMGADYGHGQWRPVVVECDLADDAGAVTIPQAMVDQLADPANWSCGDCFGHEVRRYRRASTTLDGAALTLWSFQSAGLYLRP